MAVITIPFHYDERCDPSIVPICVSDTDPQGNHIHPGWFEYGVLPVADPLRALSGRILHDVWRVSEITERAVQSLWRDHRDNLGEQPGHRVLRRAREYAADLRVGGRRVRRTADVELFAPTLETLQDQVDFAAHIEAKDTLDRLIRELDRLGLKEVRAMVPMMLRDFDADEFTKQFGKSRNTLSQQFYRGMRKAAKAARISW